MASEERTLAHGYPVRVSAVGIVVVTDAGRVVWVLKPTEPALRPGDPVPGVVYADVEALIVDGQPVANNMTYAQLHTLPVPGVECRDLPYEE